MTSVLKYLAVYSLPDHKNNTGRVQIAIDLRKLARRASLVEDKQGSGGGGGGGDVVVVSTSSAPLSAIMHVGSVWERAHNAHVFIDGRLVFHFVAAVSLADCEAVGGGHALETIVLQQAAEGVEFESASGTEDIAPVAAPVAECDLSVVLPAPPPPVANCDSLSPPPAEAEAEAEAAMQEEDIMNGISCDAASDETAAKRKAGGGGGCGGVKRKRSAAAADAE